MDEATELLDYLPLTYKIRSEQEYISFLWEAFESNYTNGKYQFAFLAFHMLTMCFVYFNIWQIRQAMPDDFSKGLIGFGKDMENKLGNCSSPFTFSAEKERSILRFLKLIGCDNSKIGTYAKLVDDRNDSAHPNGNIFYSTRPALDRKIEEVLRIVREIQAYSKNAIRQIYHDFLIDSFDAEAREYLEDTDQVRELLIHKNYMSQKDIDICINFDIAVLDSHPGIDSIRSLHNELILTYQLES